MNIFTGFQHRRCGAATRPQPSARTKICNNIDHAPAYASNKHTTLCTIDSSPFGKALYVSSSIRTLTVGIGVSPIQSLSIASAFKSMIKLCAKPLPVCSAPRLGVVDYHHRWGISPRPEDSEKDSLREYPPPFCNANIRTFFIIRQLFDNNIIYSARKNIFSSAQNR